MDQTTRKQDGVSNIEDQTGQSGSVGSDLTSKNPEPRFRFIKRTPGVRLLQAFGVGRFIPLPIDSLAMLLSDAAAAEAGPES